MSTPDPENNVGPGQEQEPMVSATESKAPEPGAVDEVDEDLEIEVEAGDAAAPEALDPLAQLQAKVDTLEAAKDDNYDRFVRASADLENLRKRSRRELTDARLDERGKVLKDMLPVIDNLERAVSHAQSTEAEATKSIVEGVNLVLRQFQQALERHNVKAVEAIGKPFDPAKHEAVSQAPSAEHPPGTVISALQTGYMMEGRLLRPALVVVSSAVPAPMEPAASETDSTTEANDDAQPTTEDEDKE